MFSQSIRGSATARQMASDTHLVVNYGIRYDTTFGLFIASGRDQNRNATVQALRTAGVPFASGIPHDYRTVSSGGFAYAPGEGRTIFRAGIGLYLQRSCSKRLGGSISSCKRRFKPAQCDDRSALSPPTQSRRVGWCEFVHWRLAAHPNTSKGCTSTGAMSMSAAYRCLQRAHRFGIPKR